MAGYKIDSYFINVQNGDSAVHVLAYEDNGVTTFKAGVLVDGGRELFRYDVLTYLKWVKIEYPDFQLNAIVITHWDSDHYGGIIQLLREGKLQDFCVPSVVLYMPFLGSDWALNNLGFKLQEVSTDNFSLYGKADPNPIFICSVKLGFRCLGYDLFSGVQQVVPATTASLRDVYTSQKSLLATKNTPILLCIAVDSFILGNGALAQHNPPLPTQLSLNDSSIVLIAVWPLDNKNNPRLSLYSAGDCTKTQEEALFGWLSMGKTIYPPIDIAKLSHHGAATSTPAEIAKFQVQYMYVSAGSVNGHPTASLLAFVMAYATQLNAWGHGGPRILASRDPYWLEGTPGQSKVSDFNLLYLLSFDKAAQILRRDILELSNGEDDFLKRWFSDPVLLEDVKSFWCLHNGLTELNIEFLEEEYKEQYGSNTLMFSYPYPSLEVLETKYGVTSTGRVEGKLWDSFAPLIIQSLHSVWDIVGWGQSGGCLRIAATSQGVFPEEKIPRGNRYIISLGPTEVPEKIEEEVSGGIEKENEPENTGTMEFTTFLAVAAPAPTLSTVQKWFYSFLGADLVIAKAADGSLTSVALSSTPGQLCAWLQASFGFTARADFSGQFDATTRKVTSMDLLAITASIPSSSSNTSAFSLLFNTSSAAYQDQFSGSTQYPATGSGYCGNLGPAGGFIFAVDETSTTGTSDLKAFLSLFGFSTNAFAGAFLSQQELTLSPSTSARPSRSGVWMIPGTKFKMYFRLEMVLASMSTIQAALDKLLSKAGFLISDVILWGSTDNQTPTMAILPDQSMMIKQSVIGIDSTISFTINGTSTPFPSSIVFSSHSMEIQIRTASLDIATTFKWIEGIVDPLASTSSDDKNPSSSDIVTAVEGILNEFGKKFEIVAIRFIVKSATSGGLSLAKCCVDFKVDLNIEAPAKAGSAVGSKRSSVTGAAATETTPASPTSTATAVSTLPILFEFEWTPGSYALSGSLPLSNPNSLPFQLDPTVEWVDKPMLDAFPPNNSSISISALLDIDASKYPNGIPNDITEAKITLEKSTVSTNFTLTAGVVCNETQTGTSESDVPPISFNLLDIYLGISSTPTTRDIILALSGAVSLQGPGDAFDEKNWSSLGVDLSYNSADSSWNVTASADDLSIANMYSLFAADSRSAIADVFSAMTIVDADLTYTYEKTQPSQLDISAEVLLGPLLLTLEYKHQNGGIWTFDASVSKYNSVSSSATCTLGDVLCDLLGKDEALPDFINNLSISLSDISVNLQCESVDGSAGMGTAVIFSLDLTIGDMTLTFAQLQPTKASASTAGSGSDDEFGSGSQEGDNTSNSGSLPRKPTKISPARILRFALPQIPGVDDVPVVGHIAPPVDEVAILWANRDITVGEATLLSENAFTSTVPLLFNQFSPQTSSTKPGDVVALVAGCHLQLAASVQGKQDLLLDHAVGDVEKKKAKSSKPSPSSSKAPSRSASPAPSSTKDSPTPTSGSTTPSSTVAPLSKQAGPLSISGVALQMGSDFTSIALVFTATLRIGPLSFSLIDLGLSLDLSSIKSFSDFSSLQFTPTLSGLALSFDKPPSLDIEGLLVKEVEKDATRYVGGLKASFETWGALAVGMYQEGKSFNDMFAFAHIQGLIAELGWAEINGLSAGLGYNTELVPPDAADIQQWPFIALNHADLSPQSDLVSELNSLIQPESGPAYIVVEQGSYWLAVGLTVLAFKVLDVDAVLSVEMTDSDDCIINITAEATTYFPNTGSEADAFILVDIGATMTLDTAQGYMFAQGQLTPLSYVLSKDCHLTGGMVYATWISPNQHEGDFVVSVGGFNPKYQPPAYYPAAPPRVGISWAYDSDLSILGQAYFAVTPACLMGGACLDAQFDCGWLKVSFSAWADFFVQLHPFWFDLHVGFNFSVEVHLGCSFLAINLGPLTFGADLHLWGPSVSGTATLHFWFMSHTICFGSKSSNAKPAKLDVDAFLDLVRNQDIGSSDGHRADDYLFTITAGTVSSTSTAGTTTITPSQTNESITEKVYVRGAQLNMVIKTRVPILSATFSPPSSASSTDGTDGTDIADTAPSELYAAPMQLTTPFTQSLLAVQLTSNTGSESVKLLYNSVTTKVPPTLWGLYSTDLASTANAAPISHTTGYSIRVGQQTYNGNGLPIITYTTYSADNIVPPNQVPLAIQPLPPSTNVASLDPTKESQRTAFLADVQVAWNKVYPGTSD
ncbi:hypothetical protein FBULB1_11169 [Fusarium bulbicola]|nr:hypothetical protein FBULB1_11169 [Fusarium bulbicola]